MAAETVCDASDTADSPQLVIARQGLTVLIEQQKMKKPSLRRLLHLGRQGLDAGAVVSDAIGNSFLRFDKLFARNTKPHD